MKKLIIKQCLNRRMKSKDGAKLLSMHEKAFLRLKYRCQKEGESALIPKKPGPKRFILKNRTSKRTAEIIKQLAVKHPDLGPNPLADELWKNTALN